MEYADELAFMEYAEDFELDKNRTYTYEDIKDAFLAGYNHGFGDTEKFF